MEGGQGGRQDYVTYRFLMNSILLSFLLQTVAENKTRSLNKSKLLFKMRLKEKLYPSQNILTFAYKFMK